MTSEKLADMCPKCGSTVKLWMQRSMDGDSKCECGFEGKHTEWINAQRVLEKVQALTPPKPSAAPREYQLCRLFDGGGEVLHWFVEKRALTEAQSRITALEGELAEAKAKHDIEVAPGVFEVRDPEKIGAFFQKRIDALADEGILLMRERVKMSELLADCERALENVAKQPLREEYDQEENDTLDDATIAEAYALIIRDARERLKLLQSHKKAGT